MGGVLSLGFLREAPGLDFFSLLKPSGKGGCSGVSVHRNKGGRGVLVGEASLDFWVSENPVRATVGAVLSAE